jgi:CBS domain-containing protein
MFVYEVMTRAPLTVDAGTSAADATALMRAEQVDAVVVVEGTQVVGLLTAACLWGAFEGRSNAGAVPVSSICSTVLCSTAPDADIQEVRRLMLRLAVDHSVVMDEGDLVGVVSLEQLSAAVSWA